MRRNMQIICIAAAAVVVGGTLWAVASSDMLGRLGLTSPAPMKESSADQRGEKFAAASMPKAPGAGAARRSAEPLAIEIAQIEAGGTSVIAGRSPPNHWVAVIANGREIATTVATDEGQWSVIVTEGIAAGPLELSVTARPPSGGAAVVSTARQLVVPASQSPTRVAGAPPAKVWAPPMAAGMQAPKSPSGKVAPPQAENRTKTASDKQALEQFTALVERARSDAVGGPKPHGSAPSGLGGPSSPAPAATSGNVTAATAASATQARTTGVLPNPAQVPIPVPITFMTDEVELTSDGARAAALLAEYLRLKRPGGISLSGHADSRGPDGYNMALSKRRLEAIERYLRQAGYAGNLSLTPKGKSEPYLGVDRTRLSQQEVYQADRRVELRLTQ
jgi:outer membrane protein OmpA-like peptidoglycan-associated protein